MEMGQVGDLLSSGNPLNALSSTFNALASKSQETRSAAAERLSSYMEAKSRQLTADKFEELASNITSKITDLVNGLDIYGKMGGIMAISMISEHFSAEKNIFENIILRIAACFHRVFEQIKEPVVLEMAARALGHLTQHGSGFFSEIVNDEVVVALSWLENPKYAARRLAAVLLLREFAINAPTLFNIHVQKFLTHIWVALTDKLVAVRYRARDALSACMDDIAKRKSRWRQYCHRRIYERAREGLKTPDRTPKVHGSLLALGELLGKARE